MADPVSIIAPGPLVAVGRALQTRLCLAFPPTKFDYQWMPARVDKNAWAKLTRRPPMVGLGFNRLRPAGSRRTGISDWSVHLATRNETGPEPRLMGDAQAPGLLTMLAVGFAMLHECQVPGVGTFRVTDSSHAFSEDWADDSLALAVIDVELQMELALGDMVAGGDARPGEIPGGVLWNFDPTAAPLLTNISEA